MQHKVTGPTPAEEDPMVDRWLTSLEAFSPSADFEEEVMARVWVPAPRWMQSTRRVARALFSRRRVWVWTGGLAASSAAVMAVVVAFALSHWIQVETAWAVFVNGVALEAWRAGVALLAQAMATTLTAREVWGITGSTVVFACIAGAAVTTVSALGLYRTMKSFPTERISIHASR